jgi:hypothetical protein
MLAKRAGIDSLEIDSLEIDSLWNALHMSRCSLDAMLPWCFVEDTELVPADGLAKGAFQLRSRHRGPRWHPNSITRCDPYVGYGCRIVKLFERRF